MDNKKSSYRVSSWKNVGEFRTVYHQIFGHSSTIDDRRNAYQTLQTWKVRRSQETMTGVLCTLTLLDIHLKDTAEAITDRSTLSTLYASTLTKFINYATSYQVGETSMYRSAKKLGIESFLIDLRHMCAHGHQLPSLEVFRKSHRTCLNWIKQFFWDQELTKICDATSQDFRFDSELADKVKKSLLFFDILAQLLQKNFIRLEDLPINGTAQQRWPTIEKFMQQNELKDFRQAIKYLTSELTEIVESRAMSLNPRTFFHEMLTVCEFFMQTTEIVDSDFINASLEEQDDTETDDAPTKRKKSEPPTIVNLYQPLIWQIAKHDHLKLFLDMLYQISLNDGENAKRRTSARFWIVIVLKSFNYYQRYSKFSKKNVILEKKINQEVRKIYSYQLDADLRKVFIFVGTQLLPSSLKYSREFFMQILNNVDENSVEIAVNLLPFVHPPLAQHQLDKINDLIRIGTRAKSSKSSDDKVYSVDDLFSSEPHSLKAENENVIWKRSLDNIDWSLQPIGKDFSIQA